MPRRPIAAFGLLFALALVLGPSARGAEEKLDASATPAAAVEAAEGVHHAPGGHGGAEAEPNILEPQPKLAVWTLVVFLLLFVVLWKFAWGPLSEALHRREEHLEHVLTETERARNESERLLAEHRRQLDLATEQVRAMLDEAHREAEASKAEILRAAQSESEAMKERAVRDIGSARDQALHELWDKSAELAVSVAGRVLGRSLGEEDHRRLIDAAVAALPESPNGRGRGHA